MPKKKQKSITGNPRKIKIKQAVSVRRLNPNVRATEQVADTSRRSVRRSDPVTRATEQSANTEGRRVLRSDPVARATEQVADTSRRSVRRSDPVTRATEQSANTEGRRVLRSDPVVREREQVANTEGRRVLRSDTVVRETEQDENRERQRTRRLNPIVRETEQSANRSRSRVRRSDPVVREAEQAKNTEQHSARRSDPVVREAEQTTNTVQRKLKRGELKTWAEAMQEYEENIKDGPMHTCYSCDRLFFKNKLVAKKYTKQTLFDRFSEKHKLLKNHDGTQLTAEEIRIKDKISREYINELVVTDLPETEFYQFCTTCTSSINKQLFPRFNINHSNLRFPVIPESIKKLTDMEERCVAARIPFMKIVSLGCDRQYGIKSGVVNVPIDVRKTIESIPAHPNASGIIEMTWMRSLKFKHHYKKARVRPDCIWYAAVDLCRTPLYANIKLSENWNFTAPEIDLNGDAVQSDEIEFMDVDNSAEELAEIERQNENYIEEETMVDSCDGIEFAPGEGQTPLSILMDKNCEELAFPTIWGGFERSFNPNVVLTYEEHVNSEIRRSDRRAVRYDHLLFLQKKSQIKQVYSQYNIAFRKTGQGMGVTARQAINKDFINDVIAKDDAYRFMANVTGTPAYWQKMKKNVMAMIRQLGIFTLFITLTAAETHWKELLVILKKVVDNEVITEEQALALPFLEKSRLIRTDPVTCALYFEYRVKELMKTWKTKDGPFGENLIKHYFYRVEFQHRGSPHIHMVVWLENAPNVNDDNDNEDFVDRLMTTKGDDPDIQDLIKLQYHRCTQTCKRTVNGKVTCRFNAPFLPMDKTRTLEPIPKDQKLTKEKQKQIRELNEKINELLETQSETLGSFDNFIRVLGVSLEDYLLAARARLKMKKTFLERLPKDCRINGYNKKILMLMRSNMDMQYVTSAHGCVSYVVDYVNKSSRGLSRLMRQCVEEFKNGNISIRERFKSLAHIVYNSSEICAQEAAWCRLRLPMAFCSVVVEFINSGPLKTRQKMLKSNAELEKLDADSTDIMKKGVIDRYSDRPDEMENICLAEFVAGFTITLNGRALEENSDEVHIQEDVEIEPVRRSELKKYTMKDGKKITQRRQHKVIRFCRFNKHQDPENYYRELFMLFLPWRNEIEEVDNINHEQILLNNPEALNNDQEILTKNAQIKETIEENFKKFNNNDLADIDLNSIAQELEKERNIEEANDDGDQPEGHQDDEPEEFQNVYDFDDTVIQPNIMMEIGVEAAGVDKIRRYVVPDQLIEDDYLKLCDSLNVKQRDYLMHVVSCFKNKDLPFYHFISGGAGVGKSLLINAMYQSIIRIYRRAPGPVESQEVLLVAYTGKAAHNIHGMTAHAAFALSANNDQKQVTRLSPDILNTMTAKLINLKLIIIDEISFMTSDHMFQIHSNLNQVFRKNSTKENPVNFGGVSVIVVGDFNQLPPIGRYVFEPKTGDVSQLCGNPQWNDFKIYELDQIMRQRDDLVFAQALGRLATGQLTQDDLMMFRSRTFSEETLPEAGKNAIRLMATNKQVDEFNAAVMNTFADTDPMQITFHAVDVIQGNITNTQRNRAIRSVGFMVTNKTQGLPKILRLMVGIRYMITVNIDVSDGLFNGATGFLRHIEIVDGKAGAVYIEFDQLQVGVNARSMRKEVMKANNWPETWTPIVRSRKSFNVNKGGSVQVCREQYPMVPAEGITTHKSQGSSMETVTVFLGDKRMNRKSLYVACSRATSLQGLFLVGQFHPPTPLDPNDKTVREMTRLRENSTFVPKYKFLREPPNTIIQIASFNIQSLRKHITSVAVDEAFMKSNIMLFQETWGVSEEIYDIEGMTEVQRNPFSDAPRARGTIIYVKDEDVSLVSNQQHYETAAASAHIEVTTCIYKDILLVNIYKNPKASLSYLKQALEQLHLLNDQNELNYQNVLLCGDFNENMLNCSSLESYLKEKYDFQMFSPRKSTTNDNTTIDGIFGKLSGYNIECFIYESYFSHHKPILTRLIKN